MGTSRNHFGFVVSGEVSKVCPTQPITFNCTVTDTTGGALVTRWIGDSRVFDCPMDSDIISLPHSGSGSLIPVSCGAATGQRQPADGNIYTSVLTVVPTLEMSGTDFTVQCAFPLETAIVMNYIATVIGKLNVIATYIGRCIPRGRGCITVHLHSGPWLA